MCRLLILASWVSLLAPALPAAEPPESRAKALLNAELVFQPSVFSGDEFPSADFLEPGRARELLGDYDVSSTFYASDFEIVERPSKPGRYGAVVRVTAADGTTYTRFRTLYRTPERLSMFFGSLGKSDVELPPATGVDRTTAKRQSQSVNDYLAFAIGRDVQRSHALAVLLAGLREIGPEHVPASRIDDPVSRDRAWWLQLKRRLNGNAKRFAGTRVAPQVVEGLDAPTLRKGTWKEAGMKPDSVHEIDRVLTEWSANSDEPFNVCVARRGVLFFDRAYGTRDGRPITSDTKHVVFSITKALSGTLLMMFVDRGLVSLEDPIEKFLPEFEPKNVKRSATMHHLFTHTADMDGHFTDYLNDLEHVYGEAYPFLGIGEQHRYNGSSIGVGLKALEQISGKPLPTLYKETLFDPLGCASIESVDGSAMTWSNARDLARVGQLLANRGAYGNQRFFRAEVFEQMLPRRLETLLGSETRVTWGVGLTWFREGGLSKRTIGHGSASSCTLRVDLERDLVITMTRRTAGRGFGTYHPRFIQAVTDGVAED